jgi:WD40 repeat protein/beta-lactamase regulating signal transducer with metallopeptidase domain
MTSPEHFLAGGPWAGVALLQMTLVALLGLAAWLAARPGGPALRSAVLSASLVGLLIVPGLASVAPVWLPLPESVCLAADGPPPADSGDAMPAFPPLSRLSSTVIAPPMAPPSAHSLPVAADRVEQAATTALPPAAAKPALTPPPTAPSDAVPAQAPGEPVGLAWPLAGWLVALWLLGALLLVTRALGRLAMLYRYARRSGPVLDEEWASSLRSLAERYCVSGVALRETSAIASPLTFGLFRPVILLPLCRRRWSAGQRALILGHELAHVRRRDFFAGLVAELAACLCWFHPLVRWLAGRLRLEQEYAADAWVASANGTTDYLRCLARLALELDRGRPALAPAFGRRRPEILRRIDMLRRHPKGAACRLGKRAAAAVAALATAACLAVAGVGPLHSATDDPAAADGRAEAKRPPTADQHGDALPAGVLTRLGTTRLRHAADVTFVSFGPDGKTLVTAARDGTVRLWELATGKEVRRFTRPKGGAAKPVKGGIDAMMLMAGQNDASSFRVAFAPGGKTLAAAGGNLIQLWEVATGKELHTIHGPGGGLGGLLFSPDGRTLVGRTQNGTLFLWSTETGKEIRQIKPPPRKADNTIVFAVGGGGGGADAPGLAFTPDGKILAAAGTDNQQAKAVSSVKLWDIATGQETLRIKAPGGVRVSAVAVSQDGKLLAFGGGGAVHLCDLATGGKEVRQLKVADGGVPTLVFSPDGKTLAVRGRNQKLRVWETETGRELYQVSEAVPAPRPTGGLVFIAGGFTNPEARALAISPDSKQVAAASGSTVRIWDTATGRELPLLGGHRRTPTAITVARDGKTLLTWGADRVIRRWDAATGRELGTFPAPLRSTLAAFTADGGIAALANEDGTIRLHDPATGRELHRLKAHPGGAAALAFAPDGKVLASRGSDNTLRFFDVARGAELRRVALRQGPNQPQTGVIVLGGPGRPRSTGPGITFTPDGRRVVTAGIGNMLAFFDVTTGKELHKIESPQRVAGVAFSPDGRVLATENADRTVTLWEVASGRERGRLGKPVPEPAEPNGMVLQLDVAIEGLGGGSPDPAGPVGLTFSPDGRALAVRAPDGSVYVWDIGSGKQIKQLKGHRGRVETVAFAADGRTLASGAADTTILLWDTAGLGKKLSAPPAAELPAGDVEAIWGDLAGADAVKALRGVVKLAGAPGQAVPFLSERLKPAERVDPKTIDALIGELESNRFAVRDKASVGLLKVGEQAVPALQKVLASPPSLETRYRVEVLLEKLTGGTLTPEQLRLVRAVEALERAGSPEARRVLETLSRGAPGALPTREAEAALGRLARRPAPGQ